MGRVVHFEIHASDPDALVHFYEELFGWTFSKWEGPNEYWLITTGADEDRGINGGLLRRRGDTAAPGQGVNSFVCTVSVDDLDAHLVKSARLGAETVVPKMGIAGVGWLAYLVDPDGNMVGMMEPDENAA